MRVTDLKTVDLQYHVYRLDLGQQTEIVEGDGEELPAASHWILPSAKFHGLWENLTYDSTIKEKVNF